MQVVEAAFVFPSFTFPGLSTGSWIGCRPPAPESPAFDLRLTSNCGGVGRHRPCSPGLMDLEAPADEAGGFCRLRGEGLGRSHKHRVSCYPNVWDTINLSNLALKQGHPSSFRYEVVISMGAYRPSLTEHATFTEPNLITSFSFF